MSDRGQYRGIALALLNGPQFQDLPPEARWVFVALKINLGPCGIETIYPGELPPKLAGQTGYPPSIVAAMLCRLEERGWIACERNVVWIVKHFEFDKSLNQKNENHRKTVVSHLDGLPRLGIVRAFIDLYGAWIDTAEKDRLLQVLPISSASPFDGIRTALGMVSPILAPMVSPTVSPLPKTEDRRPKTEDLSVPTEPAGAAPENTAPTELPHSLRSCMGLVVEHLYFDKRPSEAEMRTNGSILTALHESRNWSWDELAEIIQGLAAMRNRGELQSVGAKAPVSLKWLHDKDPTVDPCQLALDAYRRAPPPDRGEKRGGVKHISDLLQREVA